MGYKPLEWTDAAVERFWRWESQFPDQYFTYRFGARIVAHLGHWLANCNSALDYGCGGGYLIRHLAEKLGCETTGADFSPAAVAAANAANKRVPRFSGAFMLDEILAAGLTFDAIVAVEVIEHLSDQHLENFFAHVSALLKRNGVIIITTPNRENLDAAQVYCPHCDHVFHRWQHVRSWSSETLTQCVGKHGLRVIETHTLDFAWRPLANPISDFKRLAKFVLGRPDPRPHLVCVARSGA